MVIDRTSSIGVGVSVHTKVHYQFHTMFMQNQQENLYLKKIFQNVHSRFLDALEHLQIHPASVDSTKTTTPGTTTGWTI